MIDEARDVPLIVRAEAEGDGSAQSVVIAETGAGDACQVRICCCIFVEPVDKLVESLSFGAHFQRKGWQRAVKRLRDILEGGVPAGDRIAVAGGNRYTTGIP